MIHLTLHQLSAYLDGELTEASTELVRRHLSQCPACTERFARVEELEETLVRLLNHDPGDAFFDFFKSAISFGEREAPPKWPRPVARAAPAPLAVDEAKTEPPAPPHGVRREDPETEIEAEIEGLFSEEKALPVDPEPDPGATDPPAVEPAAVEPRASEPAATIAARPTRPAPTRYNRREEDRRPTRGRGGAAGWTVAAALFVIAAGLAFMVVKPRVSPLPTPGGAPASEETAVAQAPAPSAEPDPAPAATAPAEETVASAEPAGPDAVSPEPVATAPDESLELPAWTRAEPIAPPPPPRPTEVQPKVERQRAPEAPRTLEARHAGEAVRKSDTPPASVPNPPATTLEPERLVSRPPRHLVPVRRVITTRVDSSAGPAEPSPAAPESREEAAAAAARDLEHARQMSLEAARNMVAPAFDAAASAWEDLVPRLAQEPESQAVARRELAQARFQAWAVDPSPVRREAAIRAARAYLLYAPPGPDRDQAWTWLGRLKH